MMGLFRKPVTIRGQAIPAPRFTGWAAFYFALYVAVPLFGLGLLLDAVLYCAFRHFLNRCYGILCLMQ